MNYEIRDFCVADATAVDTVALAAFDEFQAAYSDWPSFARGVGNTSSLAAAGEIVVAANAARVVGAVTYVGPGKSKRSSLFDVDWPIIRMLVVAPACRGHGIGRALTEECIRRARRDGSSVIALHTTPIMRVALSMYRRMGFEFQREAPAIFGVPYRIYLKRLDTHPDTASPNPQAPRFD